VFYRNLAVSGRTPLYFLLMGTVLVDVEGITFRAGGVLCLHALGAHLDLAEGTVIIAIMATGIHRAANAGIGIL